MIIATPPWPIMIVEIRSAELSPSLFYLSEAKHDQGVCPSWWINSGWTKAVTIYCYWLPKIPNMWVKLGSISIGRGITRLDHFHQLHAMPWELPSVLSVGWTNQDWIQKPQHTLLLSSGMSCMSNIQGVQMQNERIRMDHQANGCSSETTRRWVGERLRSPGLCVWQCTR